MRSVYVSPSNQKNNLYANGRNERDVMIEISKSLTTILVAHGLEVYTHGPDIKLAGIIEDSNKRNPDIHVALHSNATGVPDSKTRGCEIYYTGDGPGKKLAQFLYNRISAVTLSGDRGIKSTNVLAEVVKTEASAVLIEYDFHDNIDGANWICSNISNLANATAMGIFDFFAIEPGNNPEISDFRNMIQQKCMFDDPDGVWKLLDTHKYPYDLYQKLARGMGFNV